MSGCEALSTLGESNHGSCGGAETISVREGTWRYMVQDPSTYADPSSRFLEQTAVANATVDASYYHVHSVIEATCMRPIRVHKKRCIIGVAGT
jgi:hypothetical protein